MTNCSLVLVISAFKLIAFPNVFQKQIHLSARLFNGSTQFLSSACCGIGLSSTVGAEQRRSQ